MLGVKGRREVALRNRSSDAPAMNPRHRIERIWITRPRQASR